MLRLVLKEEVTETIKGGLRAAGRRETGGVLMGEHVGENEFAVTDVTLHRRGAFAFFVRRMEEAISYIRSFFDRSNHNYLRFNYIGEWHSHPSFELEPSLEDDASMFQIVADPAVGAHFAVLVVVKLDIAGRLLANAHLYLPDATRHRCDLTYGP